MCAGIPCTAELSNRSRHPDTRGSAAGTGTTTADRPCSEGTVRACRIAGRRRFPVPSQSGSGTRGPSTDYRYNAWIRSGTVGTRQSFAAVPCSATRSYPDHFPFSSNSTLQGNLVRVAARASLRQRRCLSSHRWRARRPRRRAYAPGAMRGAGVALPFVVHGGSARADRHAPGRLGQRASSVSV
jgi:hypothetical protein